MGEGITRGGNSKKYGRKVNKQYLPQLRLFVI